MASFFRSVRQGLSGPNNRPNGTGSPNSVNGNGDQTPPANSNSRFPVGMTQAMGQGVGSNSAYSDQSYNTSNTSVGVASNQAPPAQTVRDEPKVFFNPKYAKLGVKGNFMPLSAIPELVRPGEWLAHQCVEQYRLLEACVKVVQEVNTKDDRDPHQDICNPLDCPSMSAGSHTYTWLNHERQPIKVPAQQYISLVQRWILGKIHDPRTFPIDPPVSTESSIGFASGGLNTAHANTPIPMGPSTLEAPVAQLAGISGRDWIGKDEGFPESFLSDVKTAFRQMFRIYAHLYHAHFVEPFWHFDRTTDLNSCFVHFMTTAKLFGLVTERDCEPMQPLIDIWVDNGSIPAEAASGSSTLVQPQ